MDPRNDYDIVELTEAQQRELSQADLWRAERLIGLSEMQTKTLSKANANQRKGWMRNQPCPCGSGKKFKKCCFYKT